MRRLALCSVAVGLLLGLAESAQAVQPNPWPAGYVLIVVDVANVVDIGVVQFNEISPGERLGSCMLRWLSDGSVRQATWQNFDLGAPGALVLIQDATAQPLWDFFSLEYSAVPNVLIGAAVHAPTHLRTIVIGIPY